MFGADPFARQLSGTTDVALNLQLRGVYNHEMIFLTLYYDDDDDDDEGKR